MKILSLRPWHASPTSGQTSEVLNRLQVCIFRSQGVQMKENTLKCYKISVNFDTYKVTLASEIDTLVRDLKLFKIYRQLGGQITNIIDEQGPKTYL